MFFFLHLIFLSRVAEETQHASIFIMFLSFLISRLMSHFSKFIILMFQHLMCAEIACKVWISCLGDHHRGSVRVPGCYTIKIQFQSKQEEALIIDRLIHLQSDILKLEDATLSVVRLYLEHKMLVSFLCFFGWCDMLEFCF